jgi:hypothetical protein
MKNFLKFFYIIFFTLALVSSKALAAPTYVDTFSINGEEGHVHGLTFSSDGTVVYIVGHGADRVYQYPLDTAWDISSITSGSSGSLLVRSNGGDPRDIKFNTNGTKLFVLDRVVSRVYEWSLSTPWDVTTGSHTTGDYFEVNDQEPASNGLAFSPDGTNMFVVGTNPDTVFQYSLTTGFDISTAAYTGKSFSVSEDTNPEGIEFSSDGTQMFVVGDTNNSIFQYSLTTAWDIETASYTSGNSYSVSSQSGNPEEIEFSSDGSKMFLVSKDSADAIYEYTLSCYYGVVNCIDPTSDKDDVASVESQTESAKQLIQHTTYPVLNRMEWLRRNTNNSNLTNQNIKFQFSNPILASLSNYLIPVYLSNEETTSELKTNNWSFWSEGTVSIGKIGDSITSSAKNINTTAITIGADKKTDNGKMFGAALRLGNDDIDFGNVKNSLGIDAVSLTLYGTRPYGEGTFIDSLIGIGAFKTDIVNAIGSSSTEGSRDGHQIFSSFKIRETFKKNELNFTPKLKLDLGFTSLADYSENGSANLKFDSQRIGTIITSIGGAVDNTSNLRNGTFRPYLEYDYFADISPSSRQKISYKSDTGSTYTLSNISSSTHNFKSKLGFDFITDTGWDFASSYQRTQSKNNGYSDALYFGANYITSRNTEYAMSLDNNKAILDYKRNIYGFDITFGSNYGLMSAIPDYGANLEISNKF